jgi:hypothetical protein
MAMDRPPPPAKINKRQPVAPKADDDVSKSLKATKTKNTGNELNDAPGATPFPDGTDKEHSEKCQGCRPGIAVRPAAANAGLRRDAGRGSAKNKMVSGIGRQ